MPERIELRMRPASRASVCRPGIGRADALHELEPARQEDDRPEEADGGKERGEDRHRVAAIAEQVERHDGLGGARLDPEEDRSHDRGDEQIAADLDAGPVG